MLLGVCPSSAKHKSFSWSPSKFSYSSLRISMQNNRNLRWREPKMIQPFCNLVPSNPEVLTYNHISNAIAGQLSQNQDLVDTRLLVFNHFSTLSYKTKISLDFHFQQRVLSPPMLKNRFGSCTNDAPRIIRSVPLKAMFLKSRFCCSCHRTQRLILFTHKWQLFDPLRRPMFNRFQLDPRTACKIGRIQHSLTTLNISHFKSFRTLVKFPTHPT